MVSIVPFALRRAPSQRLLACTSRFPPPFSSRLLTNGIPRFSLSGGRLTILTTLSASPRTGHAEALFQVSARPWHQERRAGEEQHRFRWLYCAVSLCRSKRSITMASNLFSSLLTSWPTHVRTGLPADKQPRLSKGHGTLSFINLIRRDCDLLKTFTHSRSMSSACHQSFFSQIEALYPLHCTQCKSKTNLLYI